LWILVAGHTAGWILYGIAFQLLAGGVLGETTGATTAYVAVFTASYIAGYLALLTPGGLVVREIAMIAALTGAGLTGPAEAAVLAVTSRSCLAVVAQLPGPVFMAVDAARPSSSRFHTDRAPCRFHLRDSGGRGPTRRAAVGDSRVRDCIATARLSGPCRR